MVASRIGAGNADVVSRSGASRALRLEVSLSRRELAWTVGFSVLAVVMAGTVSDILALVAPLRAATAWHRYARTWNRHRDVLRAGLGISRADADRARLALVRIDTVILLVAAALGATLAILLEVDDAGLRGSLTYPDIGIVPSSIGEVLALQSGPWTIAALALTAILVGRSHLGSRTQALGSVGTALVYVGAVLAIALAMLGPRLVIDAAFPDDGSTAHDLADLLLGAAVCAITVIALRFRARSWVAATGAPDSRRLT